MTTVNPPALASVEFLTQHELSRRWKLSPRSLEKWRTLGIGPAYIKIGGRVRYLLRDVLAYEAERQRGSR